MLGLLSIHGTIVRHREVKHPRRKIAYKVLPNAIVITFISHIDLIKPAEIENAKKKCKNDLPAWSSAS